MFNPAIAGSTGGKLHKIKRNKAIVKYSAGNRDFASLNLFICVKPLWVSGES
jgi:hypothetical protein